MPAIIWVHVVAGLAAILLGTIAVAVRKGGAAHANAGTWFAVSMLILGLTGVVSAALNPNLDIALTASGVITVYFVATSWMAARRRDGRAGRFEKAACGFILALATAFAACGIAAALSSNGIFIGAGWMLYAGLAALCVFVGALDLRIIRGRTLSGKQRIARHLWRMCFAFLLATSFFFLGQQDEMPQVMRGSPLLFVPALAPLAVMAFWLSRLRFGRAFYRPTLRSASAQACVPAAAPAGREMEI